MMEQIILREYEKGDRGALVDIIRKTWNYDKFCSPRTAAALAEVYLDSCLANQTYTQVAVVDGTPAGIIMGKNIRTHKAPLSLKLQMAGSLIRFLLTPDGRAASRLFSGIQKIDEKLLESCKKDYQGEVAFFAVSPKYRGNGLGKMLFHALLQYMKQEHITDFYLFTDTSCNYGFYESQGLKRRSQKRHTFQMEGQNADMTFFVYDYSFHTAPVGIVSPTQERKR